MHKLAAYVLHRLMSRRREVDDGKPPMAQADATVSRPPFAGVVGAAMREQLAPARQPAAIETRR